MSTMNWCGRAGVIAAASLLLLLLAAHSHAGPVAKRDIADLLDGKDKRPFCNAFTGCGKKRSEPKVEPLASGAELDALAKHVVAEAKLWEQLQNKMEVMRSLAARMEEHPIFRRKRSPAPAHGPQAAAPSQNQQIDTDKQ
ncbi:cardioactive peptide-like [Penaeus indicus]|uniref:cardioactive peptide-like n=1 Tax=Penaeus indicus TaxID=29960 RepID=UPI00300DBB54